MHRLSTVTAANGSDASQSRQEAYAPPRPSLLCRWHSCRRWSLSQSAPSASNAPVKPCNPFPEGMFDSVDDAKEFAREQATAEGHRLRVAVTRKKVGTTSLRCVHSFTPKISSSKKAETSDEDDDGKGKGRVGRKKAEPSKGKGRAKGRAKVRRPKEGEGPAGLCPFSAVIDPFGGRFMLRVVNGDHNHGPDPKVAQPINDVAKTFIKKAYAASDNTLEPKYFVNVIHARRRMMGNKYDITAAAVGLICKREREGKKTKQKDSTAVQAAAGELTGAEKSDEEDTKLILPLRSDEVSSREENVQGRLELTFTGVCFSVLHHYDAQVGRIYVGMLRQTFLLCDGDVRGEAPLHHARVAAGAKCRPPRRPLPLHRPRVAPSRAHASHP